MTAGHLSYTVAQEQSNDLRLRAEASRLAPKRPRRRFVGRLFNGRPAAQPRLDAAGVPCS
jgi:hypothetical protein